MERNIYLIVSRFLNIDILFKTSYNHHTLVVARSPTFCLVLCCPWTSTHNSSHKSLLRQFFVISLFSSKVSALSLVLQHVAVSVPRLPGCLGAQVRQTRTVCVCSQQCLICSRASKENFIRKTHVSKTICKKKNLSHLFSPPRMFLIQHFYLQCLLKSED